MVSNEAPPVKTNVSPALQMFFYQYAVYAVGRIEVGKSYALNCDRQ